MSVKRLKDKPGQPWEAAWREYPGGPERTKQFRRRVDADQYLVRVRHDLATNAYISPSKRRVTVEDYYSPWAARQAWRTATRTAVRVSFENHVLPHLGRRPLGSVRRGVVEAWAANLPLAAGSARLAVQHLGTMFEAAVDDGLVAVNPVRRAKRPRVDASPAIPFTLPELDRLHDAAPPWFRVALTLGAACGLRQSEVAGLTVDRLNFLGQQLTVDRQLTVDDRLARADPGRPVFAPPKTERSYRKVPLAPVAVEALAAHLEQHGSGVGGLVLHRRGEPLLRQRFSETWRSLRERAEMPGALFHTCRHTYASTLLSGGVPVAAAAEYLGHSPAEPLKTYAHLMPGDDSRARSVVQAAFTRRGPAADLASSPS